ncbi:MAG: hypothetical protein U5Q03_01025 [Bacteroidota bacterium]|nr:hypothetical protein [Bacteroidota bacterium]
MKKYWILIVVIGFALLGGCKKFNDNPQPDEPKKFADLKVDQSFKFETVKEIEVKINVESSNPQMFPHVITIYEPTPGGDVREVRKGMTSPREVSIQLSRCRPGPARSMSGVPLRMASMKW